MGGGHRIGRHHLPHHSPRHYFVTMVYEATDDLKLAQELARHESTETTERYTHLINPKLDEAYRFTFENR